MIHKNSKIFFQQWIRARQRRYDNADTAIPAEMQAAIDRYRLDIRPAADRGFRIIELGAGVRALLGRSPLGTPFNWLFHVGERTEVNRLVEGAWNDGTGLVASAIGTDDGGERVLVEIILLPAGPNDPPALAGCLSPVGCEDGASPAIGLLRLVSVRVPLVPDAAETGPSARMRAGMGLELGAE